MHPDLASEQAHLDHAHDCLEMMRAHVGELVAALKEGAATDFNIAAAQHRLRVYRAALDPGPGALCFGRIDGDDGDRWYVGRRHVEDAAGDPVVVDWRAAVAVPFYRATYRDPQGLRLRRRFVVEDRSIAALVDEDFTDPDAAHRATGVADPLLAELDRARTGTMRDIVATIQAEQDVVIRAPMQRLLVVQGGPGTGKTAVGLHRAALLLYDHRDVLDRDGVLVVGPNRRFLRYIAQVLPSLGETSVVQTTVAGLGSVDVTGIDTDEAEAVKGDVRMVEVLRRAAWARVRPPDEDLVVRTRWGVVSLAAGELAGLIELCAAEERTVNGARARFVAEVHRRAHRHLLDRRTEGMKLSDALAQEVRTNPDLRRALERIWPSLQGAALVRRLLTNRAALAEASAGVLSDAERRAALRKPARKGEPEPWTAADIPLVDEAEALLGDRPRRFGHVVVDEAQDVSPMAWRLLARRCVRWPSMTLLGDLAQATAPAATARWEDVVHHLGAPAEVEVAELTVGYRVPGQLLDVANRLLPATGASVRPTASVRVTPAPPVFAPVDAVDADAIGAVLSDLLERNTSVGVVTHAAAPALRHALVEAGLPVADDASARLVVLPAVEAKGLEFDAVVVVEPAAFLDAGERGARLLYVALTRAVQELVVVHARPLPASLVAA